MGRRRKVFAPTAAGRIPVATEQAKSPKKNVNGRIIVENTEPLRGPRDEMFPEWMLLINPFVDNGFKMHFLRRLDVVQEGRDLLAEMETKVCEAILLKGPQIRFMDDGPPGGAVVTLFVDGAKVVDREPVEKFFAEEPKIDMKAFLNSNESFKIFHAGLDTKEQERVGVFLVNGSLVDVHVDTDRKVEIRLVMAEYTTRMA